MTSLIIKNIIPNEKGDIIVFFYAFRAIFCKKFAKK